MRQPRRPESRGRPDGWALGARLRGLWTIRGWVAGCAALALLVSVWSVAKISLLPPALSSRSLQMASASTPVVVDTPQSALIDMRQDTYRLDAMTNRAVLLGNVMASPPVRASIARRANVPVEALQVVPPLTPRQPRVLAEAGNQRRTRDILKLNDQYRLYIQANPTVPVLHIYAQTPTAESAGAVANAAVDAMREHLADLAASAGTPAAERIRLMQVGRARGEVINAGISLQVALLAFALTFVGSCAAVVFFRRLRDGWRFAARSERGATNGDLPRGNGDARSPYRPYTRRRAYAPVTALRVVPPSDPAQPFVFAQLADGRFADETHGTNGKLNGHHRVYSEANPRLLALETARLGTSPEQPHVVHVTAQGQRRGSAGTGVGQTGESRRPSVGSVLSSSSTSARLFAFLLRRRRWRRWVPVSSSDRAPTR